MNKNKITLLELSQIWESGTVLDSTVPFLSTPYFLRLLLVPRRRCRHRVRNFDIRIMQIDVKYQASASTIIALLTYQMDYVT